MRFVSQARAAAGEALSSSRREPLRSTMPCTRDLRVAGLTKEAYNRQLEVSLALVEKFAHILVGELGQPGK